jgi:hypothetical protein
LGQPGNQSRTGGNLLFGWAQGKNQAVNPSNRNSNIDFHDNGFGTLITLPKNAANPSYDSWASKSAAPKAAAAPSASSTLKPNIPAKSDVPPKADVSPKAGTAAATTPAPAKQAQDPKPPKAPAPTPSAAKAKGPIRYSEDDEGWVDVKTIDTNFFKVDDFKLERRQSPKFGTFAPTATPSSPPPTDLGLFPKMSGMPHKPPGSGVNGGNSPMIHPPKYKRGAFIPPRRENV